MACLTSCSLFQPLTLPSFPSYLLPFLLPFFSQFSTAPRITQGAPAPLSGQSFAFSPGTRVCVPTHGCLCAQVSVRETAQSGHWLFMTMLISCHFASVAQEVSKMTRELTYSLWLAPQDTHTHTQPHPNRCKCPSHPFPTTHTISFLISQGGVYI